MTVSVSDFAELQQHIAENRPVEHDLSALETVPEILAWLVASMRAKGSDEVDAVELLVRAADMLPDEVRKHEKLLRRLGYIAVCDRLKLIAGRRRLSLAPLQ